MSDRISVYSLLDATARTWLRLIVGFGVVAVISNAVYRPSRWAIVPSALLAAATFFSAPLASGNIRSRRGIRLFSAGGRSTLYFCFIWGAASTALFIALLQLAQGMEATATDYLTSAGIGALACTAVASIAGDRW
jgi:hypothetical protein